MITTRERESRWCSWAADGDTAAACLFAVLLCSLALPALLARYAWSASAGTCSAQRSTWLSRGCVRRRRKGRRSWGDRKKKQVSFSCLGVRCWVSLGCPSPLPTALQGDRGWPAAETLQGATEARGGKSKGKEEEQKEESDRETVEERSERTRAQQRGAVVPTRESRSRGLWPRKTKKSTHTHTSKKNKKARQDKNELGKGGDARSETLPAYVTVRFHCGKQERSYVLMLCCPARLRVCMHACRTNGAVFQRRASKAKATSAALLLSRYFEPTWSWTGGWPHQQTLEHRRG